MSGKNETKTIDSDNSRDRSKCADYSLKGNVSTAKVDNFDDFAAIPFSKKRAVKRSELNGAIDPTKLDPQSKKAAALVMYNSGDRIESIASVFDAGVRTVKQWIADQSKIFPLIKDCEKYTEARQDLFAAVEHAALRSMSKIIINREDTVPLNQVVYAFQALHNAGRLERNLSTSNTESRVFTAKFETPSQPTPTAAPVYIAVEDTNDR